MSHVQDDGLGEAFCNEVLIVEDTAESLALLSQLMNKAGHTVRQAQDGEMALISVTSRKPDLILLDINMPGIDGFEVCRRLKASEETSGIPVVFLSARQDLDARVEGLKLGAVDYIGKPYDPEEVIQRVRINLELYNLKNKLEDMCELRTQQLKIQVREREQIAEELRTRKQELSQLTAHLEDIREAERRRIAREIHDELGQSLTVARIDLTRLHTQLSEEKSSHARSVTKIIETIEEASDTARSISENLRPGMLDLLGLGAALEHHVKRFRESTGTACRLEVSNGGDLDLEDRLATAVFRIVQESLTNVAKYAQAESVVVKLADLGEELLLVVQDDGVGMDLTQQKRDRSSFGLLGMSERAQALGGKLTIESEPGRGTRIEASLPKTKEENE